MQANQPSAWSLAQALRVDPRWASSVARWQELTPAAARYGEWPPALAASIGQAAARLGINRLYWHQARAIAEVLAGRHVLVATGTASGKSPCYVLPILQARLDDPGATALLVFPTKALAHDQLAALQRWSSALPGLALREAAYDGDTPRSRRATLRAACGVLLTNPDMLHTGILPQHTQWQRLFEGLRFVVLDEAHVYRGVFGSHVANVMRRLRRIAAFYGSRPQFVLSSATVANPEVLGQQLCGEPVTVVTEDSSPRGPKTFIFYNPPVIDAALNLRRSPLQEAAGLARHFIGGGVQTIVFCRTRRSAELLLRALHSAMGIDEAGPKAPVRGYRGGYMPHQRRAIEAALRHGRLRGVVATNALELGIDIGALDACILVGYPGTIASTWQQAGRAGRRGEHAIAVLVASADPLDQFIVRHPDYFFGRSPEHALLNPDNPVILLDHVRCAVFELPVRSDEAALPFGHPEAVASLLGQAPGRSAADSPAGPQRYRLADALAALESQGIVRQIDGTWFWLGDAYPAAQVSLRSAGPEPVAIMLEAPAAEEGAAEAQILGTVERQAAPTMVHEGAIYLHDGLAYRVERLDWEAGRAHVVPDEGLLYSIASHRTSVRPLHVAAERRGPAAAIYHGDLEVRSRAVGYRLVRIGTGETVGWGSIDLPEQVFVAGAYWLTLEEAAVAALEAIGRWRSYSGDRGPNWERQRDLARARDGYACAVCRTPEPPGRSHDVHHVRPFHTFGWRPGENEAYRQANQLENLVTLCPACHRAAERTLGLQGGLSGIGHSLLHLASLFLMCARRDLAANAEAHAAWTGKPTIAIFERAAASVGFGAQLFQLHDQLLLAASQLIADCPCANGCPSCVGPGGDLASDPKGHALDVLRVLRERREG